MKEIDEIKLNDDEDLGCDRCNESLNPKTEQQQELAMMTMTKTEQQQELAMMTMTKT